MLISLPIINTIDNAVNVKVIMRRMEKVGSRVTIAGDGREAVELYRANPDLFDIVSKKQEGQEPKTNKIKRERKVEFLTNLEQMNYLSFKLLNYSFCEKAILDRKNAAPKTPNSSYFLFCIASKVFRKYENPP